MDFSNISFPHGDRRVVRCSVFVILACTMLVSGCMHGKSEECIRQAAHVYLSTTPEDLRIISASALMRHIDSGMAEDLVVVDTRSGVEHAAGHIPGSIHIPFRFAVEKENLARLPKDKILVLVCKSGHTASMLNAVLNMLGYRAVTLKDGMKGWAEVSGPWDAGAESSSKY